jgi:hypothetical protein
MSDCHEYRELRIEMELGGDPVGDAPTAECAAEVVRDLLIVRAGLRLAVVEPPEEVVAAARKRLLGRLAEGGSAFAALLVLLSGLLIAIAAAAAAGDSNRVGPAPFLAAGATLTGAGVLAQAPRGRALLPATLRANPAIMGACARA